jgi:hypothetical protein
VPFRDASALEEHYDDHAAMLGIPTIAEYEIEAEKSVNGPLCSTRHECNRPQGGRARFDANTSRYATVSAWGHIATYMILETSKHGYATNWAYYISRCN